jgi:hypothetical protein
MSEIDIFALLKAIDESDLETYSSFSDDQLKSVQPLVLMRWLSGCKNKEQIVAINTFINPVVFKLGKHKNLLVYSLMACSTGPKSYQWKKKESGTSRFPTISKMLCEYYGMSLREIESILPALSKDDIIGISDVINLDTEEKKKIKKELNTYGNI